ncbi:hypothetical protein UFOVP1336_48 [uncultured Caudovirales phage]|uniref:Helix-turn-helix domain containing protein n=1 Tax=uncultured Caudovirales phage TaxID=2100421 RepID=A0A6J5RUA6_9CAUD|nr:hypothetical protein UFOVP1336_48 [uncultured Caudovirales phage]
MSQDKQTRADKILALLQHAGGQWVYGASLLSPEVGGSRFSARIEELRKKGHRIEGKPDPRANHALWQYRILSGDGSAEEVAAKPKWACAGCKTVTDIPVGYQSVSDDFRIAACLVCKKKNQMWRKM